MSGQAGLRLINNNYVPNGSGRDLLIYHDTSFRGGSVGGARTQSYLPKSSGGDPKHARPVGSSLGFNARNEGSTQHLNCSKDLFRTVSDTKKRMTMQGWSGTASSPSFDSNVSKLLSKYGGNSNSNVPFARSRARSAASLDLGPHADQSPPETPFTEEFRERRTRPEVQEWNKSVPITYRMAVGRTSSGGFWSQ